jgi:hypothetical protein
MVVEMGVFMIGRIIKGLLAMAVVAMAFCFFYPYWTDDPAWKYNTTVKPVEKDIIGTWRVMDRSWPLLSQYTTALPEGAILVLGDQKRYRAYNIPLEKVSPGSPKGRELFVASVDGQWEINQSGKAWIVGLSDPNQTDHEIEIRGSSPPYHFSYHIGGPDSGVVIYLERIGTANLVKLGCDKQ